MNASDVTLPCRTITELIFASPDVSYAEAYGGQEERKEDKDDDKDEDEEASKMGGEVEAQAGDGRGSLALGSWLSELALSHTATVKWIRCSDGCLNRLIGLAS